MKSLFCLKRSSSIQFSCSVISDSSQPHGLQHARPPGPSPTPGVYSNSRAVSWWCIQPSHPVVPFSSHLQSFPASVFSTESALCIRWPKYWSFSFNISRSNEYSGLISFRMDWLDLLAVQGTLKSPHQHHSSKASILRCSAYCIVQFSHPYMTTGKTIALTRPTFVSKVMSLLFNMLSRWNSFSSNEQASLNFTATETTHRDFGAQEKKFYHCFPCEKFYHSFHCFPITSHEEIGPDAMIFVFWMLSFKPTVSLSSFTFKRLFSSFSLSATRVVSSAYLRLLVSA